MKCRYTWQSYITIEYPGSALDLDAYLEDICVFNNDGFTLIDSINYFPVGKIEEISSGVYKFIANMFSMSNPCDYYGKKIESKLRDYSISCQLTGSITCNVYIDYSLKFKGYVYLDNKDNLNEVSYGLLGHHKVLWNLSSSSVFDDIEGKYRFLVDMYLDIPADSLTQAIDLLEGLIYVKKTMYPVNFPGYLGENRIRWDWVPGTIEGKT